jgi:uncharacterized membrane protein YjgN (DUF898 family)
MPYCPNCGTEYQEQPLRCACGYLFAAQPGLAAAPAVAGKFEFTGQGGDLFKLYAKLILLSIVTLGIYSFWGRTEIRRYLWSRTKFAGQPFGYHGTGKEIFVGWLVLVGVLVGLFALVGVMGAGMGKDAEVGLQLAPVLGLLVLMPLALHGAISYRWSRTSWQGRRFQYRGEVGAMTWLLVKGVVLTAVTLTLYAPVFHTQLRRYVTENTWYGGHQMSWHGADSRLFWPHLKMLLLLLPTLGLYRFWFEAEMNNYLWGETKYAGAPFRGKWNGLELFLLSFTNGILTMVTLGLAYPWALVRRIEYVTKALELTELPRVQLLLGEGAAADGVGEAVAHGLGMDGAFDWGFGL